MASSRELSGRVAVVTGATSGIGLATVRRLVAGGASALLVARDAARLHAVAAELDGDCVTCACDVAEDDAGARIAACLELLETDCADIVVHAAGAFELAAVVDTTVAAFDRALAVNLRAAFLLMREFVPPMLERGRGDFVTIGSVAGRQAFAANGAYSASKFGVRGLHAVLAAELRGTGVRATLVEPAATDTPLWHAIDRRRHTELPPQEAMMSPDAVAEAVFFAVTRPDGVAVPNILLERS